MTRSRFETTEWHEAVGRMLSADGAEQIGEALSDALGQVVTYDGTCLLLFRNDAPPGVLHRSLSPADERHYLKRYLAGPYLLDPLYQLALRADKPDMCRFRDAIPDRFHSSEYYHRYCEQTHLRDEMDFFVDVADGGTLALVVARHKRMFSKAELARLELVEPVVRAAMQRIWKKWRGGAGSDGANPDIHRRLTECFENFGEDVLTRREREITQLLLRGHSTKSVARELDIAPGTVMVHKRNLFSKLGITSQFELFSRFIDELPRR